MGAHAPIARLFPPSRHISCNPGTLCENLAGAPDHRPRVNKETVSMVRVSRGLFGSAAFAWLVAVSVVAQTPAPPQAVPAEAKKMKAAFPSSPAAIEAGKPLFAKYCRFCHGNTGAGDSTMAPKNMKPVEPDRRRPGPADRAKARSSGSSRTARRPSTR